MQNVGHQQEGTKPNGQQVNAVNVVYVLCNSDPFVAGKLVQWHGWASPDCSDSN